MANGKWQMVIGDWQWELHQFGSRKSPLFAAASRLNLSSALRR
jgi:hypothetical protein